MNARYKLVLRLAGAVCLAALMLGCADKKPAKPSPRLFLPNNCIVGALVDVGKCRQMDSDHAVCDGMVVQFACVKVKQ